MNIQPDFEELLQLLENHKTEYMVVGGYAVAFHGYPRFTKDIDIFYRNSTINIEKIKTALLKFGFTSADFTDELFSTKGNIITFGLEPIRVDLLNDIDGVEFETAWPNCKRGKFGSIEINFISKLDLIKNKSATPRLKDKADIEELS